MNEALAALLRQRLADPAVTAKPPSKERRRVRDVIRKIVAGEIGAPRADTLQKIAAELDLDPAHLLAMVRLDGHSDDIVRGDIRPAMVPPWVPAALPADVPVMGTAAGSLAGSFRFEDGVIDYVRRPPGLAGARDVYAIFITGESMVPEHRPGDLRFVNPHRPPHVGDTVVVQIKAHETAPIEAYIKHLVRRTADWLVLAQLNQPAEIKVKPATVVAVHKVLSVNELFGV